MEIYYLGLILVVVIIIYIKVGPKPKNKAILKIKDSLENIVKDKEQYKLEYSQTKEYDLYLELENNIYLIRVVSINREQEIVITNKITWILNKKKSTPNIKNKIPGIKSFMEHNMESEKQVKKVVVVYPGAYKILKFINENEMVIVNSKTDVFGCKVIQYSNLSDIENL